LILASFLTSGLPLGRINSQILGLLDQDQFESNESIFVFVLSLLSKNADSPALNDPSKSTPNFYYLFYLLNSVKVNTTDFTEILWDIYLKRTKTSSEVLAMLIILHLEFIKIDEV
jgi:hypothetical protein